MEIWKDIKGYENLYQVSNTGRIRSLTHLDSMGRTKEGQIIKPQYDGQKHYLMVGLCKNGTSKTKNVHRIVAETFIKNPLNLKIVNHINEIKTDNRVENLEWCTYQYNNNFGKMKNLRLGENNGCCKITQDVAEYIKKNHIPNDKTYGTTALSIKFGISIPQVSAIAHGKRWGWL